MSKDPLGLNENHSMNRTYAEVDTGESVGVADAMPGTHGGFTMAAFTAESVPVGTRLYKAPVAKSTASISQQGKQALKPFADFANALADDVPDNIALALYVNGCVMFGPNGKTNVGALRQARDVFNGTTLLDTCEQGLKESFVRAEKDASDANAKLRKLQRDYDSLKALCERAETAAAESHVELVSIRDRIRKEWKTGDPVIPSRTVKEFIVSVERDGVLAGRKRVSSAFYSNEFQLSSDGEFLKKGWYINSPGSQYYPLLRPSDTLHGWMEMPEWVDGVEQQLVAEEEPVAQWQWRVAGGDREWMNCNQTEAEHHKRSRYSEVRALSLHPSKPVAGVITEEAIIGVLPKECDKIYTDYERGYNKALGHAAEKLRAFIRSIKGEKAE